MRTHCVIELCLLWKQGSVCFLWSRVFLWSICDPALPSLPPSLSIRRVSFSVYTDVPPYISMYTLYTLIHQCLSLSPLSCPLSFSLSLSLFIPSPVSPFLSHICTLSFPISPFPPCSLTECCFLMMRFSGEQFVSRWPSLSILIMRSWWSVLMVLISTHRSQQERMLTENSRPLMTTDQISMVLYLSDTYNMQCHSSINYMYVCNLNNSVHVCAWVHSLKTWCSAHAKNGFSLWYH